MWIECGVVEWLETFASVSMISDKACSGIIWQQRICSRRREHGQRRKASRAMDKNAGSVFEQRNALARYGRTSGMRCVIARAERATDGGFCDFPI